VVQHERRAKKQTMHDEKEEMQEHEALVDTTRQIRVRTLDFGCDFIRQLRVRTVKRAVTFVLLSLSLHVHG
jgi:hypothetical protein